MLPSFFQVIHEPLTDVVSLWFMPSNSISLWMTSAPQIFPLLSYLSPPVAAEKKMMGERIPCRTHIPLSECLFPD